MVTGDDRPLRTASARSTRAVRDEWNGSTLSWRSEHPDPSCLDADSILCTKCYPHMPSRMTRSSEGVMDPEAGAPRGVLEAIPSTSRRHTVAGGRPPDERSRMQKSGWLRSIALLSALALIAVACGDDSGGESGGDERSIVRFAFSPDPVIDWMNESGDHPRVRGEVERSTRHDLDMGRVRVLRRGARRHRLDGDVRDAAPRRGDGRRHRDLRCVQQPARARVRASRQRLRDARRPEGRGRRSARSGLLHDRVGHVRQGLVRE